MATFTESYTIHLNDIVWFTADNRRFMGTVQDISQIPDIWVETGHPDIKWSGDPYDIIGYRRWKVSIKNIEGVHTNVAELSTAIEVDEPLSFVWDEAHMHKVIDSRYESEDINNQNK